MAYERQTWVDGTTICNAERINHIEDGIANSITKDDIKTIQTNSDTNTYSCNYINGIVESGNNANGSYTKFADGTMICTKKVSATPSSLNGWVGGMYYLDVQTGDWAIPFTELLNVQITNDTPQYWICGNYANKTSCGSVRLVRPSNELFEYNIQMFAIGKWK